MAHGKLPNYGTNPSVELPPYDADVLEGLLIDAQEVVRRYPQRRSALLPLLHLVQSVDGYVSTRGIEFCAEVLGLTPAEVSGVATFYTQYKRYPNGRYTVGVCTNTLCAIMGGDEIFERVSDHLCVGHDETTQDGAITLERVECNAACDYAPVVMTNWEFFDNQTPDSAVELVDALRAGDEIRPTRGADRVATFKEVARVLAGFPDGRAGEGPSAGPASLAGLRVAHEMGWSAPEEPADADSNPIDAPADTSPADGTAGAPISAPAGDSARAAGSADTPANAPDEKPGDGKVGD